MTDDTNFNRIMEGLAEVEAIADGRAKPARVFVPDTVDVRAIRTSMGLSQGAFAARYGFKVSTVKDWEQKRRQPEASARVLLKIIEKRPEVVDEVLRIA
jgi:putative transcriptional regulator